MSKLGEWLEEESKPEDSKIYAIFSYILAFIFIITGNIFDSILMILTGFTGLVIAIGNSIIYLNLILEKKKEAKS